MITQAMKCATTFAKWLAKHYLTDGVCIYVDHKRYTVSDSGELVYDIDAEPKEYFEWAGDFMSASFEGPLYDVLNYGFESEHYQKLETEMIGLFEKFGHYSELGNAWNLSLYKI